MSFDHDAWRRDSAARYEEKAREKGPKFRRIGRNRKRQAEEFARCYHSEDRVRFVKSLRCCVPTCVKSPAENAHIEIEGMGRKAHYTKIVALCAHHHRLGTESIHAIGREAFEKLHGLDLEAEAAWTEIKWREWGPEWVEKRAALDGMEGA